MAKTKPLMGEEMDRWMMYNRIVISMVQTADPEDIIICLRKLHDNMHDDYTEDYLHDWVYDAHMMHLKNKGVRRERPITTDVNDFVEITNGSFSLQDCYRDLNANTKQEKTSIRVALTRMNNAGLIEKLGVKDGVYRKINKDIRKTKFITGELKEFPVRLPIELNEQCKIYSKNIIIVAGSKSSGKTAFLMKIALENQMKMPVVYLNSEMGDEEYTARMMNFGIAGPDEIKFDMIDCHANFADHITTEKKIFIIDYLEVHDNFYEVAQPIRAIHEKLQDGIAIIAIQKKDKALLGRGAEFSMEKSRLYLSIDYMQAGKCSRFTIVDAKSPKRMGGVKGAFRDIKIIGGSRFSPVDGWKYPNGGEE
jgi:hypothetical protein